jgi:hypothetical protein
MVLGVECPAKDPGKMTVNQITKLFDSVVAAKMGDDDEADQTQEEK